MDHQRQHSEAAGRQQHIGPGQPHPVAAFAQIRARFDLDQVVEARRAPAVRGDLVMGASQRMDAAFQRADKFVDRPCAVARLRQQSADQRQYVAHTVIQLGDQQFLLLMRPSPFGIGRIGQAQDHFQQRGAQRFCDTQFSRGEGQRPPLHQLRPLFEALARRQARPVGAIFDGLFRVSGPAHRSQLLRPEQHDIVARPARQGDRQQPRYAIGIGGGFGQDRRQIVGGIDLAGGDAVHHRYDRDEGGFVRCQARKGHMPVDIDAHAIGGDGVEDDVAQRALDSRS